MKAIYYRKFHDKWLCRQPGNFLHLDYDDLRLRPAAVVAPIIQWVSGSVDEQRLSDTVAAVSASRGGPQAFTPRVIEDSRHFDRDLLAPFEAYVLQHCPAFNFKSELHGSYEDHPLYGQILFQDPEEPLPPGEDDRLDAAARRAPDHPELLSRLAERELERGNADRAIALLERCVMLSPFFGQSYRTLTQACRSAERPIPPSCTDSKVLFACTDDPRALVEAAVAMLAEERLVNAVTALSLATIIQPDHHRANHLLGKVLGRLGRLGQARVYAEKASRIRPRNKESAQLLADIDKRLKKEAALKADMSHGTAQSQAAKST